MSPACQPRSSRATTGASSSSSSRITSSPVFDADHVWAATRDDLRIERVVRYRIEFWGYAAGRLTKLERSGSTAADGEVWWSSDVSCELHDVKWS